jgi:hypothetical protein
VQLLKLSSLRAGAPIYTWLIKMTTTHANRDTVQLVVDFTFVSQQLYQHKGGNADANWKLVQGPQHSVNRETCSSSDCIHEFLSPAKPAGMEAYGLVKLICSSRTPFVTTPDSKIDRMTSLDCITEAKCKRLGRKTEATCGLEKTQ